MSDLEPRAKMPIYRPPISTPRLIMSTSNSYEHTPWNISMLHFDVICATSKNNREICGHSVEKWFSLMEISMWIPHTHTQTQDKVYETFSRSEPAGTEVLWSVCWINPWMLLIFLLSSFFLFIPCFLPDHCSPLYIYSSLLTSIKQHKINFFSADVIRYEWVWNKSIN